MVTKNTIKRNLVVIFTSTQGVETLQRVLLGETYGFERRVGSGFLRQLPGLSPCFSSRGHEKEEGY